MSRKTHNSIFNDEQRQFIKDNYLGISSDQLTKMLNDKFGTQFEVKSIMNFKQNNKLKSGVEVQWKKGHVPHNKGQKMSQERYEKQKPFMFQKDYTPIHNKAIGSERVVRHGHIQVKVTDEKHKGKKNWKYKHHLVYEQHYGSIPEGMVITFVDGDCTNFDIDNLVAVKNADLVWLNKHGMKFKDRELLESSISLGRLSMAVNEKKRQRKEVKK